MNDLRARLQRLAEAPDAPPRVDIAAARRDGRRSLRRRRAAVIAAPALAAAVAAGLVVAVAPRTPETVTVAPRPLANPLRTEAKFTWLPAGYLPNGAGRDGRAFDLWATGRGGRGQIWLTLFRPGPEPAIGTPPGGRQPVPVDLPDGRRAHWVREPGVEKGNARMRVEFGPSRWGEIEISQDGLADAAVRDRLLRAAAGVVLVNEPALFPFQMSGVPAGLDFSGVYTTFFRRHARTEYVDVPAKRQGFLIEISRAGVGNRYKRLPNTTVDGHPAYHVKGTSPTTVPDLDSDPRKYRDANGTPRPEAFPVGTEFLCVYAVEGLDICLTTGPPGAHPGIRSLPRPGTRPTPVTPAPDWASELLKPTGGLLGLYHRTRLLGLDPATWTTTPFLS